MRARPWALVAAVALAVPPPGGARASVVEYARPVAAPIVRHFEPPPTPYSAGHRGIDLGVPEGTIVRAAAAGVVAFAGNVGGSVAVSIDHADGLRSTYSYLGSALVAAGDSVVQGQPVATSGPGHGGGAAPCLHFGIRRGSEYLDPESILLDSMRRDLSRVVRLAPEAA